MKRCTVELVILLGLLLVESWNVGTARKRGSILVSWWSYSRERNPKDFRVAFVGNIVFIVAIAWATVWRIFSCF